MRLFNTGMYRTQNGTDSERILWNGTDLLVDRKLLWILWNGADLLMDWNRLAQILTGRDP